MRLIFTVDDSYGMMFNKRRQSRDKKLYEKIVSLVENGVLWMNSYSVALFKELQLNIREDEEFLLKAGLNEYCFVEDKKVSLYINQIEEMILFRWNRRYPSDLKLDVLPEQEGFVCAYTEDFVGNSHEKITMERWKKDEYLKETKE